MSRLDERKGASSSRAQNEASGAGAQGEFKFPTWKKIIGEEHVTSNWGLQYDLLAIEEYMNNMLALGWKPVRVSRGAKLSFVPCQPGEYICRTIFTVGKNGSFDKRKAAELSELLVTDGATIVLQEKAGGSQIGLIALRAASLGPFEIISDLDSRIAEYEARKKFGEGIGILFLIIAIAQMVSFGALQNMGMGFSLGAVWLVLAFHYFQPVTRYQKILKRLRHERDVSET